MTDAEILTLVYRLEQCQLAATEFHHRDHLTAAVFYLYASDFETALNRMRATLLRFTAHHGIVLYHETMTRFWMLQAQKFMDRDVCLNDSVARVHSSLSESGLIYNFYSRERLNTAEAKTTWLEPDRERLATV
jgi:hypothetical protein